MGASPLHASTVGLVRNLHTNSITAQYYCVYDDFFETVHSGDAEEPLNWSDLIIFNSFKSHIDPDKAPEINDEWLTERERKIKKEVHKQQSDKQASDKFQQELQQEKKEAQRELQRQIQQNSVNQKQTPPAKPLAPDPVKTLPQPLTTSSEP